MYLKEKDILLWKKKGRIVFEEGKEKEREDGKKE